MLAQVGPGQAQGQPQRREKGLTKVPMMLPISMAWAISIDPVPNWVAVASTSGSTEK